jgi:TonB family protein
VSPSRPVVSPFSSMVERMLAKMLATLWLALGATAAAALGVVVPAGPVMTADSLKGCQLLSNDDLYPPSLRRAKVVGRVLAELQIGPSGRAEQVVILQSEPAGAFDGAAREWFRALRCASSRAAPVRFRFRLIFNLPEKPGDPFDPSIDTWVITGR